MRSVKSIRCFSQVLKIHVLILKNNCAALQQKIDLYYVYVYKKKSRLRGEEEGERGQRNIKQDSPWPSALFRVKLSIGCPANYGS